MAGELGLLEVLAAVLALEPHHRRASPEASGSRRGLARVLTGRRRGEERTRVGGGRKEGPTRVAGDRANLVGSIGPAHKAFFFRKGPAHEAHRRQSATASVCTVYFTCS